MKYSVDEQTMTDFADGVRWRTGLNNGLTPADMVAEMKKQYGINRRHTIDICPDEGPWVRPSGWPDLDSLNLEMSGDDFIYMTYDANKDASAIAWHIDVTNGVPATLDIGHIENGTYVVDETHKVGHNTNYIRWTDDLSGYIVIRITGKIARCYAINASRNGQIQQYRQQPILERIAWVPNLVNFCTSYPLNAWTMYTLEREKVANGDGTPLKTLYYAWAYGRRLKDLDISGIHTPNVTDLSYVFYNCQALKQLDLRHWNVSKVVNFSGCFFTCRGLKRIDLTGWDTGKATNFSNMFNQCNSLSELFDLEEFDTSKATDLGNMFNGCNRLQTFPIEYWDVSDCTNIAYMFAECYELDELDLSNWDVGKVTNISSMFFQCQALKRVNFGGWETGILTNVGQMFSSCHNIESIDISWMHITSACTNICRLFGDCWSLKELDIPDDWDVSGISDSNNNAGSMFANCYSLERLTGISNWKFSFNNVLSNVFSNCRSLKEIDVSGWTTDHATNLSANFQYCYSLEHVDLSGWVTDNCTNLSNLFTGCWSLKSIGDISGWDTSNVTTFASMFLDCYSLLDFPDMSRWDFSKATTVASMCSGMRSVKEITLNNLNLAQCTTIITMFRNCYALEKITATGWLIPKLTSTAPAAFLGDCPNLRDVTIGIPIALTHSYSGDDALSHESLINILNNLPTVTTRRTLTIGSQNINRLTAEEKQIATNKNWTLA